MALGAIRQLCHGRQSTDRFPLGIFPPPIGSSSTHHAHTPQPHATAMLSDASSSTKSAHFPPNRPKAPQCCCKVSFFWPLKLCFHLYLSLFCVFVPPHLLFPLTFPQQLFPSKFRIQADDSAGFLILRESLLFPIMLLIFAFFRLQSGGDFAALCFCNIPNGPLV